MQAQSHDGAANDGENSSIRLNSEDNIDADNLRNSGSRSDILAFDEHH